MLKYRVLFRLDDMLTKHEKKDSLAAGKNKMAMEGSVALQGENLKVDALPDAIPHANVFDSLEIEARKKILKEQEDWFKRLNKINAPSVWDVTTGGKTACGDSIVIAILDRGFDLTQNDLKPNVWQNRFEIPNNNIDDDKNQRYVKNISKGAYVCNVIRYLHLPILVGRFVR